MIAATNNYTGLTTVGSGILQVQNTTALGATAAADGTAVIGGASLQTSGTAALTVAEPPYAERHGQRLDRRRCSNTVTNGSTWSGAIAPQAAELDRQYGTTTALVVGGVISGGGDLTKVGAGGAHLNGADTIPARQRQQGTLTTGNATAIPAASFTTVNTGATLAATTGVTVGGLTLNGGARPAPRSPGPLTLGGNLISTGTGNSITAALAVAAARTIYVSPAAVTGSELTISGVISGAGAITKIGAGTLVYSGSGANTNTGTTTVNEGPVTFKQDGQCHCRSARHRQLQRERQHQRQRHRHEDHQPAQRPGDHDQRFGRAQPERRRQHDGRALTLNGGT